MQRSCTLFQILANLGGLLDFWNGGANVKQFTQTPKESDQLFQRPQIISCPVSKNNDILEFHTQNNLTYPKLQTTDGSSGTSKFQTLNDFAFSKLPTPNKHISTPVPKIKEFQAGVQIIRK